MDDQHSLFDFSAPPEPAQAPSRPVEPAEDPTFSVSGLNRAIESTIQRSFPQEVWIRGEIQGLDRNMGRRHWYFELVEKEDHSDRQRSKVSLVCLAGDQTRLQRTIRSAPGSPYAARAYALLEQETLAGYTGSAGLQLPGDVAERLAELRSLIETAATPPASEQP